MTRKFTFNILDDDITPDVLCVVFKELPKKGVIIWDIPKFGHVVVYKKDYRKTNIYDIYIQELHQVKC